MILRNVFVIFRKEHGLSDGCSIHAVKPAQCVDFPVRWRTANSLDYCVGLKTLNGGK